MWRGSRVEDERHAHSADDLRRRHARAARAERRLPAAPGRSLPRAVHGAVGVEPRAAVDHLDAERHRCVAGDPVRRRKVGPAARRRALAARPGVHAARALLGAHQVQGAVVVDLPETHRRVVARRRQVGVVAGPTAAAIPGPDEQPLPSVAAGRHVQRPVVVVVPQVDAPVVTAGCRARLRGPAEGAVPLPHSHACVVPRRHDVQVAVVIHVAQRDAPPATCTRWLRPRAPPCAGALPDVDAAPAAAGDQVQVTIPVDIAECHAEPGPAGRQARHRQQPTGAAVARPGLDPQPLADGHEIGVAIVVEVPRIQVAVHARHGQARARLLPTVVDEAPHLDAVARPAADDHVQVAIVVDIRQRRRVIGAGRGQIGVRPRCDVRPGVAPVPGPQLQAVAVRGRHHVQLAVVVEVAHIGAQVRFARIGGDDLRPAAQDIRGAGVNPGAGAVGIPAGCQVEHAVAVQVARIHPVVDAGRRQTRRGLAPDATPIAQPDPHAGRVFAGGDVRPAVVVEVAEHDAPEVRTARQVGRRQRPVPGAVARIRSDAHIVAGHRQIKVAIVVQVGHIDAIPVPGGRQAARR